MRQYEIKETGVGKESLASPALENSRRKRWSYTEKWYITYLHTPDRIGRHLAAELQTNSSPDSLPFREGCVLLITYSNRNKNFNWYLLLL